MSAQVIVYENFTNNVALKIIGDVKTVLNGLVNEASLNENIIQQLKFALGAASFSDCTCIGESIIFNQVGYSCYVNSHGKLQTMHGSKGFKSPFIIGIEVNSSPSQRLSVDYPKGISLAQLFENIGKEFHAFAYVGCLLFENLSCSYLKKPPIYQENINEHYNKYWATTGERPNSYAYLFGVVIRESGKNRFAKDLLSKAFYINPLEKNQSTTISHTHGILINDSIDFPKFNKAALFYEDLDSQTIIGIRHIFTQSIVKHGLLTLFNINNIIK